MAFVPWDLHRVVFNDVLLDYGSSGIVAAALFESVGVEISLGNESVVTGDVVCNLGCTHGEFVLLILHLVAILVELLTWVGSISSERNSVLRLEIAPLARVSFSGEAPGWLLRFAWRFLLGFFVNCSGERFPVGDHLFFLCLCFFVIYRLSTRSSER